MIKTVIQEDPIGKRPLGIPHLRWKEFVQREVKAVNSNVKCREIAENREIRGQFVIQNGLKNQKHPPPQKKNKKQF